MFTYVCVRACPRLVPACVSPVLAHEQSVLNGISLRVKRRPPPGEGCAISHEEALHAHTLDTEQDSAGKRGPADSCARARALVSRFQGKVTQELRFHLYKTHLCTNSWQDVNDS